MIDKLIETENYTKLFEAMQRLIKTPIRAPKIGLGYGQFGVGKTIALQKIASLENAALLRANPTWSVGGMLQDILDELGLPSESNNSYRLRAIVKELSVRPRILIIDEIDYLLARNKENTLEVLRTIHDESGIVLLLIGMQDSVKKIKKYGHLYSRISSFVKFQPANRTDIEKFCELSSVKIEDDLIDYLHTSFPNIRRIIVLLGRLENDCLANDITSADLRVYRESEVENEDQE